MTDAPTPTAPDGALHIRPAVAADVPMILGFIRDLAAYERLPDEAVATEAMIHESLFGAAPAAEVLLAYLDAHPAGFALYFHNYSTFLGRRGLYLEDLFVRESARGRGVGRALLAALARIAVDRGCGRMEWAVLDWNSPAIAFYGSLGARPLNEWTVFRVTGPALAALAIARPPGAAPRLPHE